MSKSLFERLGGNEGITAIANDVVDNHLANEAVANRFAKSDIPAISNHPQSGGYDESPQRGLLSKSF